jgi:hypothetical protein
MNFYIIKLKYYSKKILDKKFFFNSYLICLIFFLPYSTLLKLYISTLFQINTLVSPFIILKIVLILLSLVLFFILKRKFNKILLLPIFLNIIFIFNVLNDNLIEFNIDQSKYFYFLALRDIGNLTIANIKYKIILNNIFLILLPLLIFLISEIKLKYFNINSKFLKLSFIYIALFSFYSICILIKYGFVETAKLLNENNLISAHQIYLGFLYFNICLLYLIFIKQIKNIFLIVFFILSLVILFLLKANLSFILSIAMFIITAAIAKGYRNLLLIILLMPIIYLSMIMFLNYFFSNIFYISSDSILHNPQESNIFNIMYSLGIRISLANFYIFDILNTNYFLGLSIFNPKNLTYPHNLILDIFISTGIFGLIIFLFIIVKIKKNIKLFITINKIQLLFIIFFLIYLHSIFSGYYFDNYMLNIFLSIFLMLDNFKFENKSSKSL